ncbi:MAG: BMP family ABC transporter substrate-binding protein [Romboutsia sp.]
MNFKKVLAVTMSFALAISMLVGCSKKSEENKAETPSGEKKLKIAMVTDTGGVNDQSFNQSAWEGLQKIRDEYGKEKIEVKYLESKQDAEYVTNLETLYDEGHDLIIATGFNLADALKNAAQHYPEQQFAIVDYSYGDAQPKNVKSVLFNDQEASYLVGVIAANMTKTDKVGFIGGKKGDVIGRFEYGYKAGVKSIKPKADVMAQYADSFTDAAKGKAIANQMHKDGADVIFTAGGDVGTGSIEAAKEANKYAIGVDRDQNDLAPNNVITSSMKRVDSAVYNIVKELKEGKYTSGDTVVYGLKDDGVGIAPTTDKLVEAKIIEEVNVIKDKIVKGEIKVPKDEKEYNEMLK